MIVVGGVGERDGGSGTLTSTWGAGRRLPKTGAGAVRLLMVLLRLPAVWSRTIGGVEWLDDAVFRGRPRFTGGAEMVRRPEG